MKNKAPKIFEAKIRIMNLKASERKKKSGKFRAAIF